MTSGTGARVIGGSIALSTGRFICSAVSAVGSIAVVRLLGPADYGLLSVAFIYPLMLGGLSDLGLSTAIMRYASLGDSDRAFTALLIRIIGGIVFAVALVLLAPYLAIGLNRPYIIPLIHILAIFPPKVLFYLLDARRFLFYKK